MLALTRRKGEALVINNNIEVVVLDVKGDHIKIGINAPKQIPVYRKELYTQVQEANEKSGSTSDMEQLESLLGNQ